MTIKLTVEQPTCSLMLPESVLLGSIPEGTYDRPPFSITTECDTPVRTALYAQVVRGSLSQNSTDKIDMTGIGGGTPVKPPTIEFIPQIPENMTSIKAIFHDSLLPQSSGALKIEPVENGSVRRTGYFEIKCGDLPAGQYEIPVIMNVSVD